MSERADRRPLRLGRRDLLKIGAVGAGLLAGCRERERRWIRQSVDGSAVPGVESWRATVCGQCGAGCGVEGRVVDDRVVKLEGLAAHPVNRGGVCAVGHSALQELYHPDRLLEVRRRSAAGGLEPADWTTAIAAISAALDEARRRDPKRIVFVHEDEPELAAVASVCAAALGGALTCAWPGVPGRLAEDLACRAVFGREMPTFDLATADFVLSLGVPLVDGWRSPVAYARSLADGQARGLRFVQVEPRLSLTGAKADLWLPARPGSEADIARALGRALVDSGVGAGEEAARWRSAFADGAPTLAAAARSADVSETRLAAVADGLRRAARPAVLAGGAAAFGIDGAWATAAGLALNRLLPTGETVFWPRRAGPGPGRVAPTLTPAGLRRALEGREVDLLVTLDVDLPARAPGAWRLEAALESVPTVVAASRLLDGWARSAHWALPLQASLERLQLVEPLVADRRILGVGGPLSESADAVRHPADVLLAVVGAQPDLAEPLPWRSWGDAVEARVEAASEALPGEAGGSTRRLLRRLRQEGGAWAEERELDGEGSLPLEDGAPPELRSLAPARAVDAGSEGSEGSAGPDESGHLTLVLFETVKGRGERGPATPWIQELPAPVSTVQWSCWVELAPADARNAGVATGDRVRLRSAAGALDTVAFVTPAARPGVASVPLFAGRSAGRLADAPGGPLALVDGATSAAGEPALVGRVVIEPLPGEPRGALLGRALGDPEHIPVGWAPDPNLEPRGEDA